jgi:hypothetical protein
MLLHPADDYLKASSKLRAEWYFKIKFEEWKSILKKCDPRLRVIIFMWSTPGCARFILPAAWLNPVLRSICQRSYVPGYIFKTRP